MEEVSFGEVLFEKSMCVVDLELIIVFLVFLGVSEWMCHMCILCTVWAEIFN